ncbi:MAG: hypothetical protein QME71_04200 [Dehalococcoidia bacterium]|nr:hypothetical protein [Dehalococcoidia bacterium]
MILTLSLKIQTARVRVKRAGAGGRVEGWFAVEVVRLAGVWRLLSGHFGPPFVV